MPFVKPGRGALPTAVCSVAFGGTMGSFVLRSALRCRDRVAVTSEGIWYLPRKAPPTWIAWREVTAVEAHETQQRLVLKDGTGARTIRLEYQLENFSRLREIVLRHTSALVQAQATRTRVFHRSFINKGLSLGLASLGVALTFVIRTPILLLLISVPSLIAAMCDPLRIAITPEGFVMEYPLWKRSFLFDTIRGIVLKDVAYRGNTFAAVVIERRKGRPVRLFRFREGSLALHDALLSAWQSSGACREPLAPK